MAKATKKATKYELSRTDIEDRIRELCGKLEDGNVFDSSPNEIDSLLNEVLAELEALVDDIHTKAY